MRYIEINKQTFELFSGPFTADELPNAKFMHTIPVEISDNDEVKEGMVYDFNNSTLLYTQHAINTAAMKYLKETDWYEIRSINGKAVPNEILSKRQDCRDSITLSINLD